LVDLGGNVGLNETNAQGHIFSVQYDLSENMNIKGIYQHFKEIVGNDKGSSYEFDLNYKF